MKLQIRKPGLIFLLLVSVFSSCNKETNITGDEFVEREVLVNLLVDIHLADGVTNDQKFSRKFEADSIDILTPVLEKYNVTRHMFDTTMYVYTRNPELLDQVYNDVLIKLNVMLDDISKDDDPSSTPEW
jgi:hypothetical protein